MIEQTVRQLSDEERQSFEAKIIDARAALEENPSPKSWLTSMTESPLQKDKREYWNAQVRKYEKILASDKVGVIRCGSSDVTQIKEVKGKGDIFLFWAPTNHILVVTGHEFRFSKEFPNDLMEITTDPNGGIIEVKNLGKRLKNVQMVSGKQFKLENPDGVTVFEGDRHSMVEDFLKHFSRDRQCG